ncbi:androgen-dependent TFPI-regulating protein-like [Ostrinia furnacalis]|uniref:androgen-dependent TFPI-regulating protein-like n=1 Tax=Ostrinia furnacalis TaxID=93504 RepID=UPI001039CDF5|nr:androgen-dependent TFPI-regulating protein-like [Ostrinia furnacalis]
MAQLAHYRIIGYAVTLVLHIGNTIVIKTALKSRSDDPEIRTLAFLEDCFYTIWNVVFQVMYAAFGIYCDLKSLKDDADHGKLTKYMKYRQYVFGALLCPSSMFIVNIFWPIFLYDRNLIYPEYIDRAFPDESNYIMHIAILPVVLWELIFLPRKIPISHRKYIVFFSMVYVAYLLRIFHVNANHGLWPYPILEKIQGTIFFPILFILAYLMLYGHYYLQWKITRFIWGYVDIMKSS